MVRNAQTDDVAEELRRMKDEDKTKKQLIDELKVLRTRLAGLEQGTSGDQPFDDGAPVRTSRASKPDIPDEIIAKWQRVVDLMAEIVEVPAGLIMKVDPPEIEVFIASSTKGNPYEKGERADLNRGLYCETVMAQRSRLLVPDALKDPDWDHNPDIKLGMISYLGFPLSWPDGEIFGTICVLNAKENRYSDAYVELIARLKELVDTDLVLLYRGHELANEISRRKQVEEEIHKLNQELEQRVVERTAELVTANANLKAEITERKQADEALRKSEDSLAEAQRIAHIGSWELDVVSNTLTWSDEVYRMFGLEPQQFRATYEAFLDNIHPDDREMVNKAYTESVRNKAPYSITHRLLLKDGTVKYVNERCETFYGDDGKPIRSIGTVQDITERRQAEEKIEQTAEEWRTTFDSITDWVSICDKDFRLVRVNKAFADVVKMKPEELIGKPCYEIVHGTNEPLPNCPHKVTIETKKPATAEFFEPHLGIHLEISTSPIFNENGEVVASVHLIRDITERKKMEEQLIVTDRLASIGELSSGIAHELNNPLTSVIGFSDLLLDKDVPDDVKEDLEVINREAKRTAGVVRNLLTFARKHEAEKKPVDIHNIIQKVLELRAYEQKVSNIEVDTRFAPDLPEITADGFQLQQVFINIIINAEHFMTEAHRRGTLTITTERAGDIIRASFADDGPGIAEENLGHLFDPFFTTKEVGKGTGLGLSICHGIVTEHGGRIYVESELGEGATFIVELPVKIAD